MQFIVSIINSLIYFFVLAIFAKVILSFVAYFKGPPYPDWLIKADRLVSQVTEPVLAPIRRILPTFGGLDFSPMVVIIVLFLIQRVLAELV